MRALIFRETSYAVVPVPAAAPAQYALEEAAELAGVHSSIARDYCRLGLLVTVHLQPEADPVFDEHALYELRRLDHFRRRHGLNLDTLPFVWSLWQRVQRLEVEVEDLLRQLG